MDAHLDLPLRADTQDLYLVRHAILRALKDRLPMFSGTFLDIGCGVMPYRRLLTSPPSRVSNYVGMDLAKGVAKSYDAVPPDLVWDGVHIPMDASRVDSAMATEVLEHCPDPVSVLKEVHRVLVPGGFFFFTVPFLWPLHDAPHDEYRYTPFAMERILGQAGFREITVKPLGGWDASLAQMIGLWALRRPMSVWQRRIMGRITLPIVKYLLKHDHVPDPRSGPMITGLWGTAVK